MPTRKRMALFAIALVFVSLSALGLSIAGVSSTSQPASAQVQECQLFPETGFQVCGRFLEYWRANGGLAQQGFPISGEFEERNAPPPAGDGQIHKVQYFQRARFEYHPQNARPYDVLLGLMGTEQYSSKYNLNNPTVIPAAECLPPLVTTGGMVQACLNDYNPASGSDVTVYARLIVDGKVIPNAPMTTTWYYRTTTPNCNAQADNNGLAKCTRPTGTATPGFVVAISVVFSYNGRSYPGGTAFLPK